MRVKSLWKIGLICLLFGIMGLGSTGEVRADNYYADINCGDEVEVTDIDIPKYGVNNYYYEFTLSSPKEVTIKLSTQQPTKGGNEFVLASDLFDERIGDTKVTRILRTGTYKFYVNVSNIPWATTTSGDASFTVSLSCEYTPPDTCEMLGGRWWQGNLCYGDDLTSAASDKSEHPDQLCCKGWCIKDVSCGDVFEMTFYTYRKNDWEAFIWPGTGLPVPCIRFTVPYAQEVTVEAEVSYEEKDGNCFMLRPFLDLFYKKFDVLPPEKEEKDCCSLTGLWGKLGSAVDADMHNTLEGTLKVTQAIEEEGYYAFYLGITAREGECPHDPGRNCKITFKTSLICEGDTPPPTNNCKKDLGGTCCSAEQTCDGKELKSDDCPTICCKGTCKDKEVPKTCSDTTPYNQCSKVNKGKYCDNKGNLIDKCSKCGCQEGYECTEGEETCKKIPSLKIDYFKAIYDKKDTLPLEVKFELKAKAKSGILSYSIDFEGDGIYDKIFLFPKKEIESSIELTEENKTAISHTYYTYPAKGAIYPTSEGLFYPQVKVANTVGEEKIYIIKDLFINKPDELPSVQMPTKLISGSAPLAVTFSPIVTKGEGKESDIAKYEWDFDGDGSYDSESTTSPEVTHIYTSPGSYCARLKITIINGLSLLSSYPSYIEVYKTDSTPPEPVIFVKTDSPITEGQEVYFEVSPADLSKYAWDFENDGKYDFISSDNTATHTYTKANNYTIKLKVTNDKELSNYTEKDISIKPKGEHPVAEFSIRVKGVVVSEAFVDQEITFINNTDCSDCRYEWDFDGGGVDLIQKEFEKETYYSYSSPDSYKVQLTAINEAELSGTATQSIQISGEPSSSDVKVVKPGDKTPIDPNKKTIVKLEDDNTSVLIPEKVLPEELENITLSIETFVPSVEAPLSIGAYREFSFKEEGKVEELSRELKDGKYITITIPYLDEDDDGIVDGTNIKEEELIIYYYNKKTKTWEKKYPTAIKSTENKVEIKVNHLSQYGLGASPAEETESGGETNAGGTSYCFIATACYGSPMAEQVKILSQFRDEHLLTNPLGRAFTSLYYKLSPPIARRIEKDERLKKAVRGILKPIVSLVRKKK